MLKLGVFQGRKDSGNVQHSIMASLKLHVHDKLRKTHTCTMTDTDLDTNPDIDTDTDTPASTLWMSEMNGRQKKLRQGNLPEDDD